MLPIANGLHFMLVDHPIYKEQTNKNFISHQCDKFTIYPTYHYTFTDFDLQTPIPSKKHLVVYPKYQNHYQFNIKVSLKNKGPPTLI